MPGSRVRVPPLLFYPQPLGRSRSSGFSHLALRLALRGRMADSQVPSVTVRFVRLPRRERQSASAPRSGASGRSPRPVRHQCPALSGWSCMDGKVLDVETPAVPAIGTAVSPRPRHAGLHAGEPKTDGKAGGCSPGLCLEQAADVRYLTTMPSTNHCHQQHAVLDHIHDPAVAGADAIGIISTFRLVHPLGRGSAARAKVSTLGPLRACTVACVR